MRDVVNISLPTQMTTFVDDIVSAGQFASRSEFFRHLIRDWMESRALKELIASREEIKAGKGKLLKSLKDLR